MPKKASFTPPMGEESDKVTEPQEVAKGAYAPEAPPAAEAVEEQSQVEVPECVAEFEVVFGDNSRAFFPIVDAVSSIIDATIIYVYYDYILIKGVDASHICLVEVKIPKVFFGDYKVTAEGSIGVNLDDLSKIAGRIKGDSITLASDVKKSLLLVKAKGKTARTFKVRLVDVDEENIPPSTELDVEYKNYAAFPAELLAEAVKDAKLFGDTIEMKVLPPDTVTFAAGGEVGEMECVLDKSHYDSADLKEKCAGVFSLSFVESILKIAPAADSAKWWFASNAPLKVEYSLPSGATAKYFLAPRVSEEEQGGTE